MTEESTPSDQADGHDLRTVIPRLDDLRRKCRSVGSRNDEAADMEVRINSILKRLQPSVTSDSAIDAEPIPYAALARELYAVERFFESNGFLSIAKEVAHVERTLECKRSADDLLEDQPQRLLRKWPAVFRCQAVEQLPFPLRCICPLLATRLHSPRGSPQRAASDPSAWD